MFKLKYPCKGFFFIDIVLPLVGFQTTLSAY